MRRTRIATAVSIVGVASLVGCTDKVTAPQEDVVVPFAISAEQRSELTAALIFATRESSLNLLARSDAAADVTTAFASVAARVTANDRRGAQRAIETARAALRRYREVAASELAESIELEAMALALDHAEQLTGESPASTRAP
jgi:hypothetical protein